MDIKTDTSIEEQIEKVRQYILGCLDKDRFEHSVRVAEYAAKLAPRFNIEPKKAYLAGLGHDSCKNSKDKFLFNCVKQDGLPVSKIEKEKPSLLHGRAAAVIAEFSLGIKDKDVIEAMRYHTFGKVGASDLTLLIYISDKIEPGRGYNAGDLRLKAETLSLKELACETAVECMKVLKLKKKAIAPESLEMLKWLKKNE